KFTPLTTRPAVTSRHGMMRLVSTCRSCARPAASARSAAELVGTFLRLAEIDLSFIERAPEDRALDAFVLDLAQPLDVVDAGEAARRDARNAQAAREPQRRFDVHAGEHPVAPDVGVDDGLDSVAFELAPEIERVVPGELAPAVGGHL